MSKVFAILTSRPVAYHPILAKVCGGVKAAVMLSQLIYWMPRATLPGGWIRKDAAEMEDETGLTRKEQSGARDDLLERGLIEYDVRGVPATSHYMVCFEKLESVLPDGVIQFSPNGKTGFTQRGKLDLPKGENLKRTEITTETTSEITAENLAAIAAPEVKEQPKQTKRNDKPKLANTPQVTPTGDVQSAYEALLGYKLNGEWAAGESKAARSIGMAFTLDQLKAAYKHYKAEPFWKDKRLTLRYLAKQMPEFFKGKTAPVPAAQTNQIGGMARWR